MLCAEKKFCRNLIYVFFSMLCTTGEKPPMNFSRRKKLKLNLSFALTFVETKYKPTIFVNIENSYVFYFFHSHHIYNILLRKSKYNFFSRQTLVDDNTTTTYDIIKSRKNHHAVQFFKAQLSQKISTTDFFFFLSFEKGLFFETSCLQCRNIQCVVVHRHTQQQQHVCSSSKNQQRNLLLLKKGHKID